MKTIIAIILIISMAVITTAKTGEEGPQILGGGYAFGTSDCNRVAILQGLMTQPTIDDTLMKILKYKLGIIVWDYKYDTTEEMISYCVRHGADITPTTIYYEWTP